VSIVGREALHFGWWVQQWGMGCFLSTVKPGTAGLSGAFPHQGCWSSAWHDVIANPPPQGTGPWGSCRQTLFSPS